MEKYSILSACRRYPAIYICVCASVSCCCLLHVGVSFCQGDLGYGLTPILAWGFLVCGIAVRLVLRARFFIKKNKFQSITPRNFSKGAPWIRSVHPRAQLAWGISNDTALCLKSFFNLPRSKPQKATSPHWFKRKLQFFCGLRSPGFLSVVLARRHFPTPQSKNCFNEGGASLFILARTQAISFTGAYCAQVH